VALELHLTAPGGWTLKGDDVELGKLRCTGQTASFALFDPKNALTESENVDSTRSASDRKPKRQKWAATKKKECGIYGGNRAPNDARLLPATSGPSQTGSEQCACQKCVEVHFSLKNLFMQAKSASH